MGATCGEEEPAASLRVGGEGDRQGDEGEAPREVREDLGCREASQEERVWRHPLMSAVNN